MFTPCSISPNSLPLESDLNNSLPVFFLAAPSIIYGLPPLLTDLSLIGDFNSSIYSISISIGSSG